MDIDQLLEFHTMLKQVWDDTVAYIRRTRGPESTPLGISGVDNERLNKHIDYVNMVFDKAMQDVERRIAEESKI